MYSEELVKYLLKYHNDDFKVKEKKTHEKFFNFNNLKKKYATVPINSK